ncbi:MAG TPA: hypothetical protein VKY73_00530 [Polyangiaceae bacterium]|nr:hypothetical protein [Polyangiaceae bacterium]
MKVFIMRPGEKLDFEVDYSQLLAVTSDSLVQSSWSVTQLGGTGGTFAVSGVPSFADGIAVAFFAGGQSGEAYKAVNTVQTAGGRTYVRSFIVEIKE